jgi:hypothetical protein
MRLNENSFEILVKKKLQLITFCKLAFSNQPQTLLECQIYT